MYAKENNLPVHIHYMENEEEYNAVNKDAIKPLLNNKLILAHGVYIDDIEEFKNKDISIVHNPISNLALGCGFADIVKYKSNGINVCMGTDGIGSCFNLNMFKHLTFAYLLPKGIHKDPSVIKAIDVLKMATVNGAKALGINNLGIIKPGYKADLIIVKLLNKPINNSLVALLTNDSEVLTTIINGEVLMLDGRIRI
jgi:5-methylthioadenosine/S-adenosylhomocysteine deaminase